MSMCELCTKTIDEETQSFVVTEDGNHVAHATCVPMRSESGTESTCPFCSNWISPMACVAAPDGKILAHADCVDEAALRFEDEYAEQLRGESR